MDVKHIIREVERNILSRMDKTRRNIINDMQRNFEQLRQMYVASNEGKTKDIGESLSISRATLGVPLPIDDTEVFVEFDRSLQASEVMQQALKHIMKVSQSGTRTVKESISKIMQGLIKKNVQLQYSGRGRKVKGQGKRNFSATTTYACMSDSEIESSPIRLTIDDDNVPSNSASSLGSGESNKTKVLSDFIPAGIRVRSDITFSQVESVDNKSKDDIAIPPPSIEDYCKRILRMVTMTNMQLTGIDRRLSLIENKGKGVSVPDENTDDIILPLLPLTTPEEIHGFENFISNTERAAMQFKSLVLKTGGNNLRDNIYRVLKKVFSNSCAALCSWKGHRNNFGVCELLTIKLIRSVICSLNPPLTEAKFDSMASEWFRFAKQRLGREKPK